MCVAITRIDKPIGLRERIDRGDMVVNYGAQLVYRSQGRHRRLAQCTADATNANGPPTADRRTTAVAASPSSGA